MPCTITGSPYGDLQLAHGELLEKAQKTNEMLCTVMNHLEVGKDKATNKWAPTAFEIYNGLPAEIIDWWEEHKKIDDKRRREEEAKEMTHKGVPMEEVP